MEFEYLVNQALHKIAIEKKGDRFVLRYRETSFEVDFKIISDNVYSLVIEGRSYLVYIAREKEKKFVFLGGQSRVILKPGQEDRRIERGEDREDQGKSIVTAPMPGKVIKINVSEKEAVRKNQTLAIVEAMKMENEIKSPVEGQVKKIFVAAGDLVDSEKPLLELEPK
jgi:biotin carboxyl carrier protein